MAKRQNRSNREIREPTAKKPPLAGATPAVLTRGMLPPISPPKKKRCGEHHGDPNH
jgi:hypothetical protein